MLKLSLISLFLLFVVKTVGATMPLINSRSMAVSSSRTSLDSKTILNSKTTLYSNTTPNSKMTPNSKTTSNFKTTANLQITSNRKITSNPKITTKTVMTPQVLRTLNMTTKKSGGTKLNPMDNNDFLLYIIFLLYCVHLGWSGVYCLCFCLKFITICWIQQHTRKINLFQLTS